MVRTKIVEHFGCGWLYQIRRCTPTILGNNTFLPLWQAEETTFMRAGCISVTFSVYVCICVKLSFFPSMVCCKYQLVEFLPIIPRTRVHSRPAIYDPALDFHSLVFLLLFAAVNIALVSLDGRCLKNIKTAQ
jgi:hypothetical protein